MKKFLLLLFIFSTLTLSAQTPYEIELFYRDNSNFTGCQLSTSFVEINDVLYFGACKNDDKGLELWRTDGTSEGTYLVRDIREGEAGGLATGFADQFTVSRLNDKLLFQAAKGTSFDPEASVLWVSDGTYENTHKVDGDDLDLDVSGISRVITYDDHVYFRAYRNSSGVSGLYRSDGTTTGTELIIASEDYRIQGGVWTFIGNKIYFSYFMEDFEFRISHYDLETEEVTVLENSASGMSNFPEFQFVLGDRLVYRRKVNLNGETPTQIWITDGTEEGTVPFFEDSTEGYSIRDIGRLNDNTFYYRKEEDLSALYIKKIGQEPYAIISEDLGNGVGENIEDFKIISGQLYFLQDTELWRTDGTMEGTEKLFDNASLPHKYNETLYFADDSPSSNDNHLRSFNGDPSSVQIVGGSDAEFEFPQRFNTQIDGKLLFFSNYNNISYRLYALDLPPNSVFNPESAATELSVFPNPTQSKITIPLPDTYWNEDLDLTLHSMSGQTVLSTRIKGEEQINLTLPSDLINGMYFLRMSTKEKHAFGKLMVLK